MVFHGISIHILHFFWWPFWFKASGRAFFLGQIPSPLWILVNFFMAQLSLRRVVALAVVALGWGQHGAMVGAGVVGKSPTKKTTPPKGGSFRESWFFLFSREWYFSGCGAQLFRGSSLLQYELRFLHHGVCWNASPCALMTCCLIEQ